MFLKLKWLSIKRSHAANATNIPPIPTWTGFLVLSPGSLLRLLLLFVSSRQVATILMAGYQQPAAHYLIIASPL